MPYGELKINNVDAFAQYGLSLTAGAKAALMTPAPNKERARNKSRLRHGEDIAGTLERKDKRELTLPMHITARNEEEGLERYAAFCAVLDAGTIDIEYSGVPDTVYHCKYLSCSDFREAQGRLYKFTLKLEEPNPNNRAVESE